MIGELAFLCLPGDTRPFSGKATKINLLGGMRNAISFEF